MNKITQIIPNPRSQVAVCYFHIHGEDFNRSEVGIYDASVIGIVSDPDPDHERGHVQTLICVDDSYYTQADVEENFSMFFCGFHDASLTKVDAIKTAREKTGYYIKKKNKEWEDRMAKHQPAKS